MSPSSPRPPRVFICYQHDDAARAGELFDQLVAAGAEPWLDKRSLALGDDWRREIQRAVGAADVFVVCLSAQFNDVGFRQTELRWAQEALARRPPGWGFIIPFVLQPCELPEWCEPWHAGQPTDRASTFDELLRAIEKQTGHRFEAARRTALDRMAELEQQLRHLTTHDPLTNLPNRKMLLARLDEAIGRSEAIALATVGVDGFTEINAAYGHDAGDEVLIEIARRLSAASSPRDTVARLSGGELAVMFSARDAQNAAAAARRLAAAVDGAVDRCGDAINVETAVGVALHPLDAGDGATLLQHAASALREARQTRVPVALYRERDASREQMLLADLRQAIERDELELLYQPLVDLRLGRATRAEALLRWQHPVNGRIAPAAFLHLAAEGRLMGAITRWVLQRAVRQCAAWAADPIAGPLALSVGVNLSHPDLLDTGLPASAAALLQEAGLPASRLILEIDERALTADPPESQRFLESMRGAGVRLAVDEFGTGYSSLTHLRRWPLDELHVDRSFVFDLTSNAADQAVVRAIVEMAHSLGFAVVAEGVETPEAWEVLGRLQCDLAQGYFLAPPMSADQFRGWLQEA